MSSVTTTFYPEAGNTNFCDRTRSWIGDAIWHTAQSAAPNGGSYTSTLSVVLSCRAFGDTDHWDILSNSAILFDTSSIPTTATILSATLSLYGIPTKKDEAGWTPTFNIYEYVEDTPCYKTTPLATAIPYASISDSTWNTWTLNSAGLLTINNKLVNLTRASTFFVSCNYYVQDSDPGWVNGAGMQVCFASIDSDSAHAPKLVVTYTTESVKILEMAFNQSIFTDRDTLVWTDVSAYLRSLKIKRGR